MHGALTPPAAEPNGPQKTVTQVSHGNANAHRHRHSRLRGILFRQAHSHRAEEPQQHLVRLRLRQGLLPEIAGLSLGLQPSGKETQGVAPCAKEESHE